MNIYSFYNIDMEYIVNDSFKSKDDSLEKFDFINFKFSKDGYDSKTKNDKSLMLNPDESSKIYDIEKANENVIQIVQLYKDGSFRSFSPKS